jgi:glyoxylase-like metal-dependent hydrolase (beta-lactamase superfamily II)
MRVFPIGVGTAFGRRFFNTNLIVQFDNHAFLLVDCGVTASRSLEAIGISIMDVRHLFVSHLHADHIGGIEELALKTRLIRNTKVNLYVHERLVDGLWQSLRGGIEYTQLGRLGMDDYFNVTTYRDSFVLQGTAFSSQATQHVPGMHSFDLSFDGLLLTGDTTFSTAYAIERAQAFGSVVHDCSFNNVQKVHAYYRHLLDHRQLFQQLYVIHYEDSVHLYKNELAAAEIRLCHQYQDILLTSDRSDEGRGYS